MYQPLLNGLNYKAMCHREDERMPNFYWRNRGLCDVVLALITFASIGAALYAMASFGVMAS